MKKDRYITEIGLRRRRFQLLSGAARVILGVLLVFLVIFSFLLYFPLFRVRSIEIEGLSYIPEDKVMSLIRARAMAGSTVEHFLGLRNMLVWPETMSPEDLRLMPEAASIVFHKEYMRGKVRVEVTERPHQGIWCFRSAEPQACYWFDENGIITRTPSTEGSLILVVNDYARPAIARGEPVIGKDHLDNLFSIFAALEEMSLNPKEIRLDNVALEEIKAPTFEGPEILFSLRFPAVNLPAALDALRDKTRISELEYIDFRVENRIYYK